MIYDFLLDTQELGFYPDGAVRKLNPSALCNDPRGLSGTEVNALGLAQALAEMGHTVRVWSHYTITETLIVRSAGGGCVQYRNFPLHEQLPLADVAIAFHDTRRFPLWHARLKAVWHQTVYPPGWESASHKDVDFYISATARNAAHLRQDTGDIPWEVIPNGWDLGTFPEPSPVPGRLIYHTSAERGLHILLRALPTIKARVPEAHLVIFARGLDELGQSRPTYWHRIQDGLEACRDYVILHPYGGSRNKVLSVLATASVLAYPSEPPIPCEVMPVSVLEACAMGVPVVTAPSDGFEEAFADVLYVTASPPSVHLAEFIDMVVRVLTEGDFAGRRPAQLATRRQLVFAHTAAWLDKICQARLSGKMATKRTWGNLVPA